MPSSKVLVTDLHNLTQPLIRYELTDRFTQAAPAEGGWLRVGVDGRADDLFRYAAASVHPFVIGAVLARAPAVREFQVRQTDRGAAVVDGARTSPRCPPPSSTACAGPACQPSAGHHPLGRRAGPRRPNREGQALHPAGHLRPLPPAVPPAYHRRMQPGGWGSDAGTVPRISRREPVPQQQPPRPPRRPAMVLLATRAAVTSGPRDALRRSRSAGWLDSAAAAVAVTRGTINGHTERPPKGHASPFLERQIRQFCCMRSEEIQINDYVPLRAPLARARNIRRPSGNQPANVGGKDCKLRASAM